MKLKTTVPDKPMFFCGGPENVTINLPVENEKLYLSWIYRQYLSARASGKNHELFREVYRRVQSHLTGVTLLEEIVSREDSDNPGILTESLAEGYGLYRRGLSKMMEYLRTGKEEDLHQSFDMVYLGDIFISQARLETKKQKRKITATGYGL